MAQCIYQVVLSIFGSCRSRIAADQVANGLLKCGIIHQKEQSPSTILAARTVTRQRALLVHVAEYREIGWASQ